MTTRQIRKRQTVSFGLRLLFASLWLGSGWHIHRFSIEYSDIPNVTFVQFFEYLAQETGGVIALLGALIGMVLSAYKIYSMKRKSD